MSFDVQVNDVHITQESDHHGLSSSTAIHAAVGSLIILLVTLVQLKFPEKHNSPFESHPAIMVLFGVAAFIYTVSYISLVILIQKSLETSYVVPILKHISLVSGTLACDSLLLILSPPFGYFVFALCALLTLRILIRYYHLILQLLYDGAHLAYEAVASDYASLVRLLHQLYNNTIQRNSIGQQAAGGGGSEGGRETALSV